jgi:hypothetical protein
MRKSLGLLLGTLLALSLAGTASAKTLGWHGTLDLDLGALETLRIEGSGVATVNNSSGGNHLNTMRIAGGITGSGTVPVTDPDTTTQIPSIRMTATIGTGTISGISGAPPVNPPGTLPVKGFTRVCILTGCDSSGFLPLNNTTNSGATGIGIGGLLTVGQFGNTRISIQAGPWTLAPQSGINQTVHGGYITLSKTGFVHGAASNNSSTATESGLIQLISPQQVITSGVPANSAALTLFATLTLHFIPEPGLLLLIGSGVVGLGLLGRSRMKK